MDPQEQTLTSSVDSAASQPKRYLAPTTRIVIPTYGTQAALDTLFTELPSEWLSKCIVVDDASPKPIHVPSGVVLIRHSQNLGYGGAQKTGYRCALNDAAEQILMIHGDNQYSVSHSLMLLKHLQNADIVLGSRQLWPQSLTYPAWRKVGNRVLTELSNWRFKRRHTDLHTGSRAYKSRLFKIINIDLFSDSYLFDQELLIAAFQHDLRLLEAPMPPKYDDSVLRIKPYPALRYALGCLKLNLC